MTVVQIDGWFSFDEVPLAVHPMKLVHELAILQIPGRRESQADAPAPGVGRAPARDRVIVTAAEGLHDNHDGHGASRARQLRILKNRTFRVRFGIAYATGTEDGKWQRRQRSGVGSRRR